MRSTSIFRSVSYFRPSVTLGLLSLKSIFVLGFFKSYVLGLGFLGLMKHHLICMILYIYLIYVVLKTRKISSHEIEFENIVVNKLEPKSFWKKIIKFLREKDYSNVAFLIHSLNPDLIKRMQNRLNIEKNVYKYSFIVVLSFMNNRIIHITFRIN